MGLNSGGILYFQTCDWGYKKQDFNLQLLKILSRHKIPQKCAKRRGDLYLSEIIQWLIWREYFNSPLKYSSPHQLIILCGL